MVDAKLSESEVIEVYSKMSGYYDFWAVLTESKARKIALENSGIKNGQHILEVAVGTGLLFGEIVELNRDGRNVGIDITEGMLNRATQRLEKVSSLNYELKIGNALALEFENESIDILFNCYMLDLLSFENIDAVLGEFRRVLKPGGRLVLINMTTGKSVVSRIYEWLYKLSPRLMGGCRGLEMAGLVSEKDFKIDYSGYIVQMLFPSEILIAVKE